MKCDPFDPTRLSPDVAAVLAEMARSGVPTFDSLSVEQARAAYRQVGAMLGGAPQSMREVRDLHAPGPAGPIPLRLYLPETAAVSPLPVTVYLHGGGWVIGDLDSHDRVCRRLAHGAQCAVVAVDYRLAPEHPAPAGPDDVLAAVRWIFEHAPELGLDPMRMAVAGDSAGGGLAAVCALHFRDTDVALRAQVLFYPGTDLSPASLAFDSLRENGAVPPLTLELMTFFSEKFLTTCDPFDPRISPLRAPNHRGLPPTLIFTAECDAIRDQGRHYRDALERAGVEVEYVELPGMIHGFVEMAGVLPASARAFERAAEFLQRTLARREDALQQP
jgi:acetyl esterase